MCPPHREDSPLTSISRAVAGVSIPVKEVLIDNAITAFKDAVFCDSKVNAITVF